MDAKAFIDKLKGQCPNFDDQKVLHALTIAQETLTKSDIKYNLPFRVVDYILPLNPDEATILAILLFDIYELSLISEEKIKKNFGGEVVNLLSFSKRLLSLNYKENDTKSQLEILRRMIVSTAKDLRVILIVLSFVLHRLKTLSDSSHEERRLMAKEALRLYVPVASRLGIYRIKTELEDLAFQYTNPAEYQDIVEQIRKVGEMKSNIIEHIEETLRQFLVQEGFDSARVHGRTKGIYSIFNKFKNKNVNTIDGLYDIFAMRIILPSKFKNDGQEFVDHLYRVLGLLHSKWMPVSGRFKDYVAMPKPNGYRSLHTVVLGLAPKELDRPVEIQIRSENMHNSSEYGIASHWLYKDVGSRPVDLLPQAEWLKGLKSIQEDLQEEDEALRGIELNIFKDRIFVLTPRGEAKDLPLGATCLDFAYAVHTDLGHRCVMAKVNGISAPLYSELRDGDVVEIVTKKEEAPKLQWLSIVKTTLAKNKIRQWFSALDREHNVKEGKRLLNEYLQKINKPLLDPNYLIFKNFAGEKLNLTERENLLEEVGKGNRIPADVIRRVYPYEENLIPAKNGPTEEEIKERSKIAEQDLASLILIGGESDMPVKFAACCSPKYGDKVVAYVTRGNLLRLHKSTCVLLSKLDFRRRIDASWKGVQEEPSLKKYRIKLKVTSIKRIGLVRDMAAAISSMQISIVDLVMKKGQEKIHDNYFVLDITDPSQFDLLLNKLERIPGVISVLKTN